MAKPNFKIKKYHEEVIKVRDSGKTLLGTIILCAFVVASILTPAIAAGKGVDTTGNSFTINGRTYPIGIPDSMVKVPEYSSPTPVWPKDKVIQPNFSLSVTPFGQGWSPWGTQLLQPCGGSDPTQTMKNVGCAVTSSAMVFKYLGVPNEDPGALCTCSNAHINTPPYYFSTCVFDWTGEPATCSAGLVHLKNQWTSGDFYYDMRWSLWVDHVPPIVWVHYVDQYGKSHNHFVVVTAYANQGSQPSDFTINDPWDGTVKTLDYYLNGPWYMMSVNEFHN